MTPERGWGECALPTDPCNTAPYAGEHFQAVPLGPEPLSGVGAVVYPAPFAALG